MSTVLTEERVSSRVLLRDLGFIGLLVVLRTIIFGKYLIATLYGPEVMCELQIYSQVATDLAGGKYFAPIIHGYGIPFLFHYIIGKIALALGDPIAVTGYFQFFLDSLIVPTTYFFGCQLINRKVGLLASFLVCFSPIYSVFAMIITVASAAFHAVGYLCLFLALKKQRFWLSAAGGFFLGLQDGGGRFTPFIIIAAACAIWFIPEIRKNRSRHVKFLCLGWAASLLPMLWFSSEHLGYLFSLFLAFTGKGFEHVVMPRAFYEGIPSKIIEFIPHFFLFNPLCAVPLLAVAVRSFYLRWTKRLVLSPVEKTILINIVVLAFFLAFVMTYVEPSEITGWPSRPLRYYFIFVPFIELIAAKWILDILDSKYHAGHAILNRIINLKVGYRMSMVLGALLLLAPPLYAKDNLLENFQLSRPTTVLANTTTRSIYNDFKNYSFSKSYEEYLSLHESDKFSERSFLPMEFYGIQAFKEALREEYEHKGIKVQWRSWFLNMPVFSLDAMKRSGKITGLPQDVIFYFMEKKALAKVQQRFREWPFSVVFEKQVDDWQLFRKVNPGVNLERNTIEKSEDLVVVKIPVPRVSYNSVRFRFDRRDIEDSNSDFVVPSSFVFLDEIGFGWQTSVNVSDPADWNLLKENTPLDSGVRINPLVENEFRVRTVEGSYQLIVEWRPMDEVGGVPFDFPLSEINGSAETVELPENRFRTSFRIAVGDVFSLHPISSRTFCLYRMELTPENF